MGSHGRRRSIVCVECGARAEMTLAAARRALWELWPGGGKCRACRAKVDVTIAPLPDLSVENPVERVIVRCSSCGKELASSNEFDDGWRPNLHWLTTDENKRRLREEHKPIPLCPGRSSGAVVVRVEIFRPDPDGGAGAWVPR